MEDRALQKFHQVTAEIKGQKLSEGKGDGDVVLQGVKDGPEIFTFHPLGVERKPCSLQRIEVAVHRARMAVKLIGKFCCRLTGVG